MGTITFLGVHISEDLTWSYSTDQLIKKDQQQLYFLRKLRGPPNILTNFYRYTIESMLPNRLTVWYDNSTVQDHQSHQDSKERALTIDRGVTQAQIIYPVYPDSMAGGTAV